MHKYLLLLLLFVPKKAIGQQDAQLFFYNVGFGGITAGIGAVFNKPKGTDWKKAFVHAFWQGSIGGTLHYSAKKTVYLLTKKQDMGYGLPAMILHAAGNSMIENAAYNRRFLETWNLNYGPVRFDLSFKGHVSLKARLLPMAVYGVIHAARYGKPDWSATLLTGCITFKTDQLMGGANKLDEVGGLSFSRSIAYTSYYGRQFGYGTFAHELVHYFQFNEAQVFNAWLSPMMNTTDLPGLKKVFTDFIYFDAPYFSLSYAIEGNHTLNHYYRNFFEMEAERFATNRDVSW